MPMRGVFYALLASILFGVTTPAAKALLQSTMPVMLAGLFYLGSGIGLTLCLILGRRTKLAESGPSLKSTDLPWLSGAIMAGGIVAPILLMIGLNSTQASAASLFLNFEGVLTALIAWFVFRENFDKRILLGMLVIVIGGILLSVDFSTGLKLSSGVFCIVGACLGWAVDNNLTRKISNANPAQIAGLKGLTAGLTNTILALFFGAKIPSFFISLEAMCIGFLGYGVSLVLFVLALRHIGAARTGAYFALAPFVGAIVSILFLREPIGVPFIAAASLMAVGLWLHLTEDHSHEHVHEEMEHEHEHVHDDHHQHDHDPDDPPGEPHTHVHRHSKLRHTHPHFPDLHHNHH
ncbi:MAG: DMT family transporter [Candidatus Obscuribacterales bacterium]|nr:DMT family transporter [Candidatus Obscuribacterales bacterium]